MKYLILTLILCSVCYGQCNDSTMWTRMVWQNNQCHYETLWTVSKPTSNLDSTMAHIRTTLENLQRNGLPERAYPVLRIESKEKLIWTEPIKPDTLSIEWLDDTIVERMIKDPNFEYQFGFRSDGVLVCRKK
jgi:hypothetical protein